MSDDILARCLEQARIARENKAPSTAEFFDEIAAEIRTTRTALNVARMQLGVVEMATGSKAH